MLGSWLCATCVSVCVSFISVCDINFNIYMSIDICMLVFLCVCVTTK